MPFVFWLETATFKGVKDRKNLKVESQVLLWRIKYRQCWDYRQLMELFVLSMETVMDVFWSLTTRYYYMKNAVPRQWRKPDLLGNYLYLTLYCFSH